MKKMYFIEFFLMISFISLCSLSNKINDEQQERLKIISKYYKELFGDRSGEIIVTDSSRYKWTIALCAYINEDLMGYHFAKDSVCFSRVDNLKSLHGNKLYMLYVKDKESYFNNLKMKQPIGQTIIKETWNVKEVDSSSNMLKNRNLNDGKWYSPTTVSQLFIMYKELPSSENDNGWVYGIVDIEKGSEGIKVLTSGKLSNCISCHKDTKYDRIFGKDN
jgi:hypothetical protein